MPYSLFYSLLFACGLKPSEALNIMVSDIDLVERKIIVGTKRRSVDVPESLISEIKNSMTRVITLHESESATFNNNCKIGSTHLFASKKYKLQDGMLLTLHMDDSLPRKNLIGLLKQINLDPTLINLSSFRNAYILFLIKNWCDIPTVKKAVGLSPQYDMSPYLKHLVKDISVKDIVRKII